MREITIDLDSILALNSSVGYEIAKKLSAAEIELYKKILTLTPFNVKALLKEKLAERVELFESVVRAYPIATKREDGTSEYLRSNMATCLSAWRKLTKGDMRKEYLVMERLNEYILKTDPKYLKKLSNWLKDVVLEPEDTSKIFSQSGINIL